MRPIIIVSVVVCVLVVCYPLALIWAINTLFDLSIAYTFKTWLAALIAGALLTGTSRGGK